MSVEGAYMEGEYMRESLSGRYEGDSRESRFFRIEAEEFCSPVDRSPRTIAVVVESSASWASHEPVWEWESILFPKI